MTMSSGRRQPIAIPVKFVAPMVLPLSASTPKEEKYWRDLIWPAHVIDNVILQAMLHAFLNRTYQERMHYPPLGDRLNASVRFFCWEVERVDKGVIADGPRGAPSLPGLPGAPIVV